MSKIQAFPTNCPGEENFSKQTEKSTETVPFTENLPHQAIT